MAAIIYRQPGERWVPDINASPDPKKGGGPFAVEMDDRRAMGFGEWGLHYDPSEIRTEFWLRSRHKALSDTFSVCGRWGVSAEFRAAVEALEPGLHQFFPITIRRPKGGPILRPDGREAGPDEFFLINCLSVVDCVIPELCSGLVAAKRQPNGRVFFSSRESNLVVSRAAVAGRHLWHSKTDGVDGYFFISDALRDLLVARKLQGFVIRPVGEA
jgi:hypothetical protein